MPMKQEMSGHRGRGRIQAGASFDKAAGADLCRESAGKYPWQEWRDSNPQPPVLETGALAS
jgi:hypothetical protein